jgi:hypothetical protein
MLMYSPLSAYFDDVIPQQPALSNDGKQRLPALGGFTSPIPFSEKEKKTAAPIGRFFRGANQGPTF